MCVCVCVFVAGNPSAISSRPSFETSDEINMLNGPSFESSDEIDMHNGTSFESPDEINMLSMFLNMLNLTIA